MKRYIYNLFIKKITIAKWQLNLFGVTLFLTGSIFGLYILGNKIIWPKIFATGSPWTQTDWSGGQGSSTNNQYSSASNVDATGTAGQFSLTLTSGWSNDYTNWQYRKKINFNNTNVNIGVTAENLTNFPVLVKLDKDTDIDYAKTKAAGADIRFTDSDGTVLSYEIEKWDVTGSSYVWVKVPQIDINSSTDYMYIYYGNSTATDGQSAANVWSNGYAMVQHLNDTTTSTVTDSTTNKYIGNKRAAGGPLEIDGKIGKAEQFGATDFIDLGNILNPGSDNYTIEIWFRRQTLGSATGSILYNKENLYETSAGGGYENYAWQPDWNWDGGSIAVFSLNNWYYSAISYDKLKQRMYLNGLETFNRSQTGNMGTNASRLQIGARGDTAHSSFFIGDIDEMRVSNTLRSAAWLATAYKSDNDQFITFDSEISNHPSSGTLTSNIFDSGFASDWGNLTYISGGTGTVVVKVRTSNSATMEGATDWATCIAKTSGADLSGGCVTDTQRYVQYQITLQPSGTNTPNFSDITIAFSASDQIAPTTNASGVTMVGVGYTSWTKTKPKITWTAGADNEGGGGLLGYCVSLDGVAVGQSAPNNDPASSSGVLPHNGVSSNCPYAVNNIGTTLDLSSNLAVGVGFTLTSNYQYYFSIKAIDLAGNIYGGATGDFQNLTSFKYDNTAPTNVKYISSPGNNFSNVNDMSFSWPTSGSSSSSDNESGLLGWQYQIDSNTGNWVGTTHETNLGIDYIPVIDASYNLTSSRDGSFFDTSGIHTIYFRTVDRVGNFSSDATIRTGAINYGGAAPSFTASCTDTLGIGVSPATSSTNMFSLSWNEAVASNTNSIAGYYYMINADPPSSLSTLRENSSTYMANGVGTSVALIALPNVNKGTNKVYVVAIDNASTPNYSSSNCIKGTFYLDSSDPDNVGNLVASDSSIKASSQWNVTLTWTAPVYQGAGNLTYLINRSTDNKTFTQTGSTSGLSYVDNTPDSTLYYYKIYTKDGANAQSSGTNVISITPTGKWTNAPSLDSGPTASSITTKKATVTWGTSRGADSKVQYGTSAGNYGSVEPSNSTQVASHSIQLTGLNPGTTYYYKVKWTDEDGNTGTSDEKSFQTDNSPVITDPKVENISISSVIVKFIVKGATKVKIFYGKSTAFGSLKEMATSTSETSYTATIEGLDDGTKYYYKINTIDSESSEYEGNTLTFETLPRPKVTNVRIQEVRGTAQPTVLVTWTTNTEVSSIITYYPLARPEDARDEINVAMTKGDHKMVLKGLFTQTDYILLVKGRDKVGNEAVSDRQQFTTATDTRPPSILNLKIEGSSQPTSSSSQSETSQLVVSWSTDEPATSQVEYGEGSGDTYSQKTQEDTNLIVNHLVIISGLTPSKVYHLRALSKDKANNIGNSIDTATITPKSSDNAFDLVITNLSAAFGFLGGLNNR